MSATRQHHIACTSFIFVTQTPTTTTTARLHQSERKTLKNFGFGCSLFVVHILCMFLNRNTDFITTNDDHRGHHCANCCGLRRKKRKALCGLKTLVCLWPASLYTSYDPLRASYKLLFEFMSSCTNCCDYLTFFHSNKNLLCRRVDSAIVCCWRRGERYDVYYVCNNVCQNFAVGGFCGDDIYETRARQALVLHIRLYTI